MRHVYYLVVDSPTSDDEIAHELGSLADRLLKATSGTTVDISLGQIVPRDSGVGLRSRVVLEEVEGRA